MITPDMVEELLGAAAQPQASGGGPRPRLPRLPPALAARLGPALAASLGPASATAAAPAPARQQPLQQQQPGASGAAAAAREPPREEAAEEPAAAPAAASGRSEWRPIHEAARAGNLAALQRVREGRGARLAASFRAMGARR